MVQIDLEGEIPLTPELRKRLANRRLLSTDVAILCLLKQHNAYKADSCFDYEKTFPEGDVLSIKKMKRRAFHLRLLIDRSKNKKVRREAIKEYVSLIQRISPNN